MWQQFAGIRVTLLLVIWLASTQAAVIRPAEPAETTTAGTLNAEEATTTSTPESVESSTAFAASRDIDATVQIGPEASVDPAPGTVPGDLSVRLDRQPHQQKSAKLLLLSTPAKRPAEVEQQLEELDENETSAAGSAEASVPTTTPQPEEEDISSTTEYAETTTATATAAAVTTATIDRKAMATATTKLFAIDATISSQDSSEPNVAVAVAADNATVSIAEQPQPAGNNNVAIELALVEPEAEYVLLDTSADLASASVAVTHDELQLGSFTHIDSDAHLQPVVHSVEIVPTRFDDPLIVNYVHNFR
ncbi:hypothetical protein KR093_009685 [Drosophila rubida]|uniref:Uncharacterized protein n=1 Tax=Drosophila rubida TaxID=30044 RepID=A0AAD4K2H0_9MUSC|nr:hypothetical protein KR093_009685 [Drosophila rubida]